MVEISHGPYRFLHILKVQKLQGTFTELIVDVEDDTECFDRPALVGNQVRWFMALVADGA